MTNRPSAKLNADASTAHAINDTAIRRFLTKLALRTTARLYRRDGVCSRITPHKIVKKGALVDLTEAASMQYVGSETSIPVPKVHCAFVSKGKTYIVMQRIPGKPIMEGLQTLDELGQDRLLADLRRHLDEMRALAPPAGAGVQSCVSSSLCDCRMPKPDLRFGPFDTIHEFHNWLRDGLQLSDLKEGEHRVELEKMIIKQDGTWPAPVFTHADLSPSNILVHNGKISGIIDWEFSGWYPHYWEYTSSWYGNRIWTLWQALVDKILDPLPEELEMEITRQKWWGEF